MNTHEGVAQSQPRSLCSGTVKWTRRPARTLAPMANKPEDGRGPGLCVQGWAQGPPPPATTIRATGKALSQNELLPRKTKFDLVT